MVEGLKLKWVYPNKKTSRISLQKKLTDLESGQVLMLLKGEFGKVAWGELTGYTLNTPCF